VIILLERNLSGIISSLKIVEIDGVFEYYKQESQLEESDQKS
jgi:hypothetical protein